MKKGDKVKTIVKLKGIPKHTEGVLVSDVFNSGESVNVAFSPKAVSKKLKRYGYVAEIYVKDLKLIGFTLKMQGRRYNKGKLRYDLIPPIILEELAKVYTYGAHHYSDYEDEEGNLIKGTEIPFEELSNRKLKLVYDGANNWKLGAPDSQYIASMFRHVQSYRKGEVMDELGTHHLGNAMWNLACIIYHNKNNEQ